MCCISTPLDELDVEDTEIPHQKAFNYGTDVSDTVKAIGVEVD